MANLLNLERVSKAYGVRPLLADVSLGVGAGDRIGVVGRNGDGKTTLLNVLTGLVEPDAGSWWWVVVPSAEGMSTPGVYRHHDELRPEAPDLPPPPDEVVAALAGGDVRRLAAALHNDLEEAACDLRPDLARLLAAGVGAGALRGLVSGSGPTCVFLCESAAHARAVAGALTADDRRVVLVVHGPVAGAHLLTGE
jgi:4-diphosphocytidyl-2-C-methyl-D-erythritol kinase